MRMVLNMGVGLNGAFPGAGAAKGLLPQLRGGLGATTGGPPAGAGAGANGACAPLFAPGISADCPCKGVRSKNTPRSLLIFIPSSNTFTSPAHTIKA